jgi:hypothetical protein
MDLEPFTSPDELTEDMGLDEPDVNGSDDIEVSVEDLVDDSGENMAPALAKHKDGKKVLARVAKTVMKNFTEDEASTKVWREKCGKLMRLFSGELPQKDWPWKDAANAHVPILLENLGRLQARLMSEIFGDFTNVVGVVPVGKDDEQVADIISAHDNWQFRNEIPDFRRQMDRSLLGFLLNGDCVVASWRDEELRENRHEYLTPDEFIVPYVHVSTRPDLSDLPRHTWVKRLYANQIEAQRKNWNDVDKVLKKPGTGWDEEPEAETRKAVGETIGEEPGDEDGGLPHMVLDHQCWFRLPGSTEFRWCRVILHKETEHVLWFGVLEEVDWRDQQRYDREVREMEVYRQAIGAWESEAQSRELDAKLALGELEGIAAGELRENPDVLMAASRPVEPETPRPVRPEWAMSDISEPEKPQKRKVSMFAHGVCLENLVGATGLGVGAILGPFNQAADTALSQFTDQATLANCWTIITTGNLNLGEHVWGPGKVTHIEGYTGGDLQKHLIELKPEPANPQLLELVQAFSGFAQSAAQSPDVLTGEAGKSGETFRGLASRIEQATKQLTIYAQRFSMMLKQVYENNARLNAVYLPEHRLIQLKNDMLGTWKGLEVGRSLYQRDYRVEIRSDLKFTSEAQRIAEADQLVQMPAVSPALQANYLFQYLTIKKALMARGEYELVQALGAPPGAPPVFGAPTSPPAPPPMPPGMGPPPGGPGPQGASQGAAPGPAAGPAGPPGGPQ